MLGVPAISYQELLNQLPREAGLVAEAARALHVVRDMNRTFHVAASLGQLNMDLADAESHSEAAFARMFDFLGVLSRRVPSCIALGTWLVHHAPFDHRNYVEPSALATMREWLQSQPLVAELYNPIRRGMGYIR